MADVVLGKKEGYSSGSGAEPITVVNGDDTVTLGFVDDYSKIILTAVDAAGDATIYEAALTERA